MPWKTTQNTGFAEKWRHQVQLLKLWGPFTNSMKPV